MAVKPKLAVKSRTATKPIGAVKPNKKIHFRQSEFSHLAEDIISNINEGIYIVQNGKFVYVSPLFEKLSGYSYADLAGTNPLDYLHPDDREMIRKKAIKLLKGKSSAAYEYRFTRKNGEEFWVLEMITSITYQGDRAALVSIMDITERKQMEDALRQSEEKNRTIIENIRDGYFEVDLAGNFIFFNDAICHLLKYPREELLGKNSSVHVNKEDLPIVYNTFAKVYHTGKPEMSLCCKAVRKDGTTGFAEMTVFPLKNQEGEMIGFRGIGREITQRMKLEEKLRQSEEQYRAILENMQEGYFEVDLAGNITFCNNSMCRFLDYTQEEMIGINNRQLTDKKNAEKLFRAFNQVYQTGEPTKEFDWQIIRKDGTKRFIEASISLRKDSKGKSIGFQGITRDVTERKRNEEKILFMATHDTLTGLPNRLMFSQLINHAIQTAQRYQREFAVLFIDLDRFKAVNDIMGHEAGDQMLKEIASRLKQALRAVDVAARFGGDEFIIFIEEVSDPSHVAIVAQKILTNIIKPITIMGREYRITASIGICMFPKDAEDEQSLMKNADIAMYLAKEEGKNNYRFYSENIKSKSLGRLSIETNLRWALERNELSLHYQAKVDFKTNMITGVEALLRWQNPYLGSVTPIQFIPVAEETGLILSIGRWVIRKVCEQNMAWQQQGLPGVCIAVNLSPQQLDDDHLIDDIRTALEDSGMAPSLLELEITEGMVTHNSEHTIGVLAKIKNLGVRITIDDFGTGYSSLAQIKHFPIDTLKVDRSFVHSVVQDADGKAIIRAMIALSKTLSLTIVAEGVETEDQMNFLKEHACDEMQGYYFSKPIVPEEFADLLRKHVPYPPK